MPGFPANDAGPVFREPWEAHAFAIVVTLHERGVFSWPEWAAALGAEIAAARERGDPDDGSTYYQHWLAALESLVTAKGLGSVAELTRTRDAWDRASQRTPHGAAVSLSLRDFATQERAGGPHRG
jgi:nitrile hydratase accessory protein